MNRALLIATTMLTLTALAGDRPSLQTACQKRFAALCTVMQRCSTGSEDLGPGCQAIDSGCEGLRGTAKYDEAAVESCVAGLRTLTCATRADPNDAAAMDFEARVEACRPLLDADASR